MIHDNDPPHASVVCSEDHQRQSLNTTYWESREDVKEVLSWERSYNSRHNSFQYYHASIVCHKNGKPVTNHLFLKPPRSGPFTRKQECNHIADFRQLIQQFSQFAGHCLVTVSQPEDLFVAVHLAALLWRRVGETNGWEWDGACRC